jgi:hypothetical protein
VELVRGDFQGDFKNWLSSSLQSLVDLLIFPLYILKLVEQFSSVLGGLKLIFPLYILKLVEQFSSVLGGLKLIFPLYILKLVEQFSSVLGGLKLNFSPLYFKIGRVVLFIMY